MDGHCHHYCSHGGICELDSGHDGTHDSGYCQWPSSESLTKAAADAILAGKPGGLFYLSTIGLLEDEAE